MPYILYKSNGTKLATIADGSIDKTSTDLTFVGKNYAGYGEILNQNIVKLLENFANSSQPTNPMLGQLWYDTTNKHLTVYDGTRFKNIQNFDLGTAQPRGAVKGDLWFNEYEQKLYFNNGIRYVLIGPQTSEFTGINIEASLTTDDSNNQHYVLKAKIEDDLKKEVVAVFSRDQYTPNVSDNLYFENFQTIKQGITLQGANPTTGKSSDSGYFFWGTARHAERLGDHEAEEYVLKQDFNNAINYGLTIPNDAGVTIGSPLPMIKIYSNQAAQKGIISVINGNKLDINVNYDDGTGGTETNIISIINKQIIPNNADQGIDLGTTGVRFSNGFINTFTVTHGILAESILATSRISTTNLNSINFTATNILATIITATTFVGNFTTTGTGIFTGNSAGVHTGNIITSSIVATGGELTSLGTIQGDWSLVSGSKLRATYAADLAERYHADDEYEVGTVLVIGGDNEVTVTNQRGDYRVAGIISNNPAYMMNDAAGPDSTHPYIALKGRVPCKVLGVINKGDPLITSQSPGFAVAFNDQIDNPASILGRALEDFDGNGEGLIEVMV
jgi:hypothetical protein